MTHITQAILAEAVVAVERMPVPERLRLGDEIFSQQPNLLASVLVLKRMGASEAQMQVALHVLFVAWTAMKSSGLQWPVISQDTQDICLQRLTARMRFAEGLGPELMRQASTQHAEQHDERYLLAFVYGHMREAGFLAVKTDAEKYVLLAVLNLVECIAFSAPMTGR